jgi:biopolymer transport protein ExbD
MPMDLPKAASGEDMQTVFSVELTEDGKTFVDSTQVAGDLVIGEMATEAKKKNPELRAVIRADQKVPHGRVIQVLDTLKQAKLSKVAFAVAPSAGANTPKTPAPAATP